jgi:glutamyl-tRNA reductase
MSAGPLRALVAHARTVPAADREALAGRLRAHVPAGSVLLETCHRVELYIGRDSALDAFAEDLPAGARLLEGEAVADHAIGLAVGLRSAVLAEDQLLHQLRRSLDAARSHGPLPIELDRLFDVALRAGRRGRSWLPAGRPSLADLALDLIAEPIGGRSVLIVGSGEMGRRAALAATARGATVAIASRTPEHAAAVARELRVNSAALDPGPSAARLAGVVVALRGPWQIGEDTIRILIRARPWIVDLSAPPALPVALRDGLAERSVSIDGLAQELGPREDRLVQRLRRLAETTLRDYLEWSEREPQRAAARAMADHAAAARDAALADLWRRLPALPAAERAEIERMTHHLAQRLLQEPMDRLGHDVDGRHERAARELFGL